MMDLLILYFQFNLLYILSGYLYLVSERTDHDRKLLSDLSRCEWESLKVFFQKTVPEEDAVAGTIIALSRCKRDDFSTPPKDLRSWCARIRSK